MKLQVYVLTVGRDIVFETLDSLKNITIPHDLTIWYHALPGEVLNLDTFNRLTTYTGDVIMATKNQGSPAAYGFGQIYKDYDYLLTLDQDMVVKEGAVEKMLSMHTNIRRVAAVGEGRLSHEMQDEYEMNNVDNLPDWAALYNREAINEVGARAAFFPSYGFDNMELHVRFMVNNWRVINHKNLFLHGGKDGKDHEISHTVKSVSDAQHESFNTYLACQKLGFRNYNWWGDKI